MYDLESRIQTVVREIVGKVKKGLRLNPKAIEVLHYGSEEYLHELFEKRNAAADHCSSKTTKAKDLPLIREVTKK